MPRLSTHWLPYAVISSCLIYFHLRQKSSAVYIGGWATNQGDHAIAVHGAVPLHVPTDAGKDAGWSASLAVTTVTAVAAFPLMAPDWDEEGIPSALTLFHSTVLIICKFIFWTWVTKTSLEAEDAAFAVVPGKVRGSWDAKQWLEEKTKQENEARIVQKRQELLRHNHYPC